MGNSSGARLTMNQPLNELNRPVGELLPNWKPAARLEPVVLCVVSGLRPAA
jgi:hypothetical protein